MAYARRGSDKMSRSSEKMRNCSVVILGDSYSTFEGYVPAHQKTYYPKPEKVPDLTRVEETWWYQLTTRRNMRILVNDSYSGSTVCNHTRDGQPPESAFISRMHVTLSEKGVSGEKPDVIIIFGATNDSWLDRGIGEVRFDNWTQEELRCVLPAYCHLLDYVTRQNPQAEIYCVVNDVLKPEITMGLVKAAEHYGVHVVMLEGIDKSNGHPTVLGMAQIAQQIEREMDR